MLIFTPEFETRGPGDILNRSNILYLLSSIPSLAYLTTVQLISVHFKKFTWIGHRESTLTKWLNKSDIQNIMAETDTLKDWGIRIDNCSTEKYPQVLLQRLQNQEVPSSQRSILRGIKSNSSQTFNNDIKIELHKGTATRNCMEVRAPTLFNLYTADLGEALLKTNIFPPKLGHLRLPIMQYDLVLLDQTRIGMNRALETLHFYNMENKLIASATKPKVLIFGHKPKKLSFVWLLGPLRIATTNQYTYLGVQFSDTCRSVLQVKALEAKAANLTYGLCKLHHKLLSHSTEVI